MSLGWWLPDGCVHGVHILTSPATSGLSVQPHTRHDSCLEIGLSSGNGLPVFRQHWGAAGRLKKDSSYFESCVGYHSQVHGNAMRKKGAKRYLCGCEVEVPLSLYGRESAYRCELPRRLKTVDSIRMKLQADNLVWACVWLNGAVHYFNKTTEEMEEYIYLGYTIRARLITIIKSESG